jgi:hypothetical protein
MDGSGGGELARHRPELLRMSGREQQVAHAPTPEREGRGEQQPAFQRALWGSARAQPSSAAPGRGEREPALGRPCLPHGERHPAGGELRPGPNSSPACPATASTTPRASQVRWSTTTEPWNLRSARVSLLIAAEGSGEGECAHRR